jgi:hypothetical protein
VETSLAGPQCMNLRSVGWLNFLGAGLVARGALADLPTGAAMAPVNLVCTCAALGSVVVASQGARLVSSLGATEMHSRRSW